MISDKCVAPQATADCKTQDLLAPLRQHLRRDSHPERLALLELMTSMIQVGRSLWPSIALPKWMVKIMEILINMDDLGVFPYFWKHPNGEEKLGDSQSLTWFTPKWHQKETRRFRQFGFTIIFRFRPLNFGGGDLGI